MCAYNARGHGICCQAVRTLHKYSDKHTSVQEEIKISLPNLSEGVWLRSPINLIASPKKFLFKSVLRHSLQSSSEVKKSCEVMFVWS